MVCSYRYYCIDLTVAFVDFQIKVCEPRLYHVCQGEYVDMHEIDLDRAEFKIFLDCVDYLWMGGKPDKSKKVQHSTVYRKEESDED